MNKNYSNHEIKDHTIPSVEKAIDVLHALASATEITRVKPLAQDLNISHSTCYRILQTLEKRNWVRYEDGGFELSHGLMPVAKTLFRKMDLENRLRPVLDTFVKQSGISAKISVRQGSKTLTLLCATSDKSMTLSSRPGFCFSLGYGSSGAAFLAALPDQEVEEILDQVPETVWAYQNRSHVWVRIRQCREQGFCCDFGGYQPHVFTVSVPFCSADGQVLAVITALGMPNELTEELAPRIAELLLESKKEAEVLLNDL
jgi:DNA-binding IclR family transcriptional regulator